MFRILRTEPTREKKPGRLLVIGYLTAAALAFSGCATPGPQPVNISRTFAAPVSALTVTPSPLKEQLPDIPSAEEGFNLAREAFKVGDMATAALFAESVMERYPRTVWHNRSLFLLGRTFTVRGMTAEARTTLLRVPAEYPDLADYALFILAEHYYEKKKYTDAIGLYQRLTGNHPSSTLAMRASLRTAQAFFDAASFREAADVFERTLQEYSRSDQAVEAALGLGRSYAAAGDLPAAVRAYHDAAISYPASDCEEETEKALAALRERGAIVPIFTADELMTRGTNLFRALRYDRAIEAYRGALEADPAHPQKADILLRSGIALFHLGKRPEAASTLERLLTAGLSDCRCDEALNWLGKSYSRLGLREEAVEAYLKLVRRYPESEWADDALFLAGNVHRDANDMRTAIKYYRRLVQEYPDSNRADSAIWWQGWSYYTTGDYRKAGETLQELVSRYPRSFLVNQALYWQGRAVEQSGGRAKALAYYRRVVNRGPYTYYGYRAQERLGSGELPVVTVADEPPADEVVPEDSNMATEIGPEEGEREGPPVWTDEVVTVLSAYPSYRKTLELMYLDLKKEAAAELWSLQGLMPKRHGALLELSKAYFELGDFYNSLTVVLRNFDRRLERPSSRLPDDLWLLAYPQGHWQSIMAAARRQGVDPYFVAAIIREESQFRSEALSPAGARGVMQVMPATGAWIARLAGIRDFDRAKLFDADTNISLGTWYLAHLLKRFKGDLVLVSAAYNAGPEAVSGWIGKNGPGMEKDAFVERIPYMETRGYVKKVLRNYAEYRRIYGTAGQPAAAAGSSETRLCSSLLERCP
ncbi:MAG: lytic transglycosylase domain-containing protein [Nitrospirota bacterium]